MPDKKPILILITGGSGKATTAHIVVSALRRQGLNTVLLAPQTVKPALLQKTLGRSETSRSNFIILTLPLNRVKQDLLEYYSPDIVLVTNTWTAAGPSPPGYKNFFAQLPEQCTIFLNADCLPALALTDITGGRVFNYSLCYGGAMAYSEALTLTWEGIYFQLCIAAELPNIQNTGFSPRTIPLQSPLLAKHNVANLLSAALMVLAATGSEKGLQEQLSPWGLPRRSRVISQTPLVIDDIMLTVQSLESWLELAAYCPRPRTLLVYSPQEKASHRTLLAAAAVISRWHYLIPNFQLILCGNPLESPALTAALHNKQISFSSIPNPNDAVDEAVCLAREDDLILLGGGKALNRAAFHVLTAQNRRQEQELLCLPPPPVTLASLRQSSYYNPT